MQFVSQHSRLRGTVHIPGSKSHTIRAVLLASLADGESVLDAPLASQDTEAAVRVYRQLGATFELGDEQWRIRGVGVDFRAPKDELDVGNSGTTLLVALGTCTLLAEGSVVLTGDHQIRRRPGGPLVQAFNQLGAEVRDVLGNGCAPFQVSGRLRGGHATLAAPTSQYVTSLLLACPLADGDSVIDVTLLHERPYVQMTLDWLALQGITVHHDGLMHYEIPGGQRFSPFQRRIPADFSTATFFLVAGALGDNAITCRGLDIGDSQSDKKVIDFLREMGAEIHIDGTDIAVSAPHGLTGADLDLNDCPDALPMMAVAGCFAKGCTRLLNVPQARIKETDRIAVMCGELRKLGATIDELPDGLVIRESRLRAASVNGHDDHRVVMSLALAGTQVAGETRVATAQAAAVTYPGFADTVRLLGGNLRAGDDTP